MEKNKKYPKQLWKIMKTNFIKDKNRLHPKNIILENQHYNNPIDVANIFTKYFCNIFDYISDNRTYNPHYTPITEYFDTNSSIFHPINLHDVINSFKQLRKSSNKSIYYIPIKAIQDTKKYYITFLINLFNSCLHKKYYPLVLKQSTLIILFKSGTKTNPSNYRPIALLNWLSKIFEIIINKKLMEFCIKNNIINNKQYGFMPKSSTQYALIHVLILVQKYLLNKKYVACIFLDLKKAFDCINHHLLLCRLAQIGLCKNDIDFLKSFLSNRYSCSNISNVTSEFILSKNGVPQGSILSPLLFNIFVNNMFDHIDGDIIMYADDTTCIVHSETAIELEQKCQDILNQINTYLTKHNLFLNVDKSVIMPFNNNIIQVKIDDKYLKNVNSFKLLGIIVDNKFKFHEHSIHVNNKLNCTSYIFHNLKINKIPPKLKQLLFNSYINSHINYSAVFLYNLNRKQFKKIESTYSRLRKLAYPNENNAATLLSISEHIILKSLDHIIKEKHPHSLYNLIKIYLSNRKRDRFLLYKKPIKKLTFLYNFLKLFNSSTNPR